MVVAVGDRAAGDGNQMGLLRAGQHRAPSLLSPVGQHRFHPTVAEARHHRFDRVAADIEGVADCGLAPVVGQFEQHLRPRTRPGAGVSPMYVRLQMGTLALREAHDRRPGCGSR